MLDDRLRTAYLAPDGYAAVLRDELGAVEAVFDHLLLAPGPMRTARWAANVWREPQVIRIESIGAGVRALRAIQRNWWLYPTGHYRRAALLQEQLPHVAARPLHYGDAPPAAPLGSWTMLDPNTLLAAPRCTSPFPNGVVQFVQDREGPPNRAYLKLWEAWARLRCWPQPGERCVDLGSSPGGWTFALQRTGAEVLSVDKAPLAPEVAALPRVTHLLQSAFALDPEQLGPVDWLCCDIACYPDRLLQLVQRFLAAGTCRRMVCTIKLQGETDHGIAQAFAELPGVEVLHLHHNKHELTMLR
ncbi:MAG: hypothetical protein H6837_20725 [Planctomycetes bacterium]|nr:hypothetical protein [Planctomycetota bacterium]